MKKLIAVLLVAVLALTCFAACGKKDDAKTDDAAAANVAGMYVVKTFNGQTLEDLFKSELGEGAADMNLDALLSMAGIESLNDFLNLELKDDGTAVLTSAGDTQEGTWKQDGDKVALALDDDSIEFTVSGNELSAQVDDASVVFVKK